MNIQYNVLESLEADGRGDRQKSVMSQFGFVIHKTERGLMNIS
jgi:hypothetical protein